MSAACSVLARRYGAYGWLVSLLVGCAGVNGKAVSDAAGGGGAPSTGGDADTAGSGGSGGAAAADDTDASPTGQGGSAPDAGCGGAFGPCLATLCGNEKLNLPGESCDDGNQTGGDGCSAECQIETDWVCATPGKACVYTVSCGDGVIGGSETCDDHNTVGGDGCDGQCRVEAGWMCPHAGARCLPRCGDGLKLGAEQCDDKNVLAGDGCSDACRIEPGFACPTAGAACHRTTCGDGVKEGGESCDDGNVYGGDGCGADCRSEPACAGTSGCTSPCGDGLKLPSEDCDDGNIASGDGCSADCKLEPGWYCHDVSDADDGMLVVPVVYRDFLSLDHPNGHPNFGAGISGTVVPGMVQSTLGSDRKPHMTSPPPSNSFLSTSADFDQWYHDSTRGKVVHDILTMNRQANGTFVYDHSEIWSKVAPVGWVTPPFFPLDDRGWAAPSGPEVGYLGSCDSDQLPHNYSFTSEVRYWFEYTGGELLEFIGDDDVWVFVNGRLAVDIGGVHQAASGSITLDASAATRFGLTAGHIYEIAVFQAERHVCGSSYKLTLGAFVRKTTVCTPRCGDGIVNGTEVCDDGINDGHYSGCLPGCGGLGPHCGDGTVDPSSEDCDDGHNLSTYNQPGCGPGCKAVPRCGDGKVDSLWGETCDDGNTTSRDGCSSVCQIEIN